MPQRRPSPCLSDLISASWISRRCRAPYYEGGTLMVPLRTVAEALGYAVGWDAATGTITVDDEYIQYAAPHGGSAAAELDAAS